MNVLPFRIKNYDLEEMIGRGGIRHTRQSVVFRARKINVPDEQCAYKMMIPKNKTRFKHEAGCLRQLNHQNVISVFHRFIMDPDTPLPVLAGITQMHQAVLLLELGQTDLHKWCIDSNTLNRNINMGIFRGIFTGLKYLHSLEIKHGDIKPSKIILGMDLTPKLSGFGFKNKDDQMIVGCTKYSSPEARRRGIYVYASDVFSLGLILIQLFTENLHFKEWLKNQNFYRFSYIKERYPYVLLPEQHFLDDVLRVTVTRILKLDPDRRISLQELTSRLTPPV